MKVTVLIENTAFPWLTFEHGLSVLIEYHDKKYLLDAGSSDAFLNNAKELEISLDDVDCCVLSHGHYDHSGGFYTYLSDNKTVPVYAMETAITGSYHSDRGGMHDIGVPAQILCTHKDRFLLIKRPVLGQDDTSPLYHTIADGIYLVPHTTEGLESIGQKAGLYKKINLEYIPDDFSHELSLVFDTEKGLVIFNSCSHAGIVNILNEVKTALPDKKLYAFLGGLHMEKKDGIRSLCSFSEEEIAELVNTVKAEGLEYLYTGHCTGEEGFSLIKKHFGEKAIRLTGGMSINL